MQDNINTFHKEAFATPQSFTADVDDSYVKAPYTSGLRTQGFETNKYTSGDTRYQKEEPLPEHVLVTLPSKVSKRYSPQKREQNTGMPLPPEPSFMKNQSGQTERITSIRGLLHNVDEDDTTETVKSTPVPGVDYARTSSEAAALLERLGRPISYEARHSADHAKKTANTSEGRIQVSPSDRIVVSPSQTPDMDIDDRIVLSNIPDKTFENVNVVPVGQEMPLTQKVWEKTSKTFVATRRVAPDDAVSMRQVIDSNLQSEEQTVSTHSNPNLISLVEERLVNTVEHKEILQAEDAPQVIRTVIEDFVQMKESQNKERNLQMKTIENKVKKVIQAELPEEADNRTEAVNEIKQIIQEVVASHPDLVQRNTGKDDMEYSLAARDAYLRLQIEQELRDKFDVRLTENNKLVEKQTRTMFEDMINKFLNP